MTFFKISYKIKKNNFFYKYVQKPKTMCNYFYQKENIGVALLKVRICKNLLTHLKQARFLFSVLPFDIVGV